MIFFVACFRRDPIPSVCLDMDEQAMKGTRESEDINTHHLLQQHLYKSRKHVSFFLLDPVKARLVTCYVLLDMHACR